MSRIYELIKEKCPDGVEYRSLEQLEDAKIITLGRGKVISKKDIQDNPGKYPIYSSSAVGTGILGTYGDYMFDDVRLSWSIDGGGKFFYRDAPKYSVTNVCGWLTVDKPEILNIKYLYFALSNEWSKKVFDYVHKAHPSVIRKEYTIPVPPLEIQQEIVGMLNSFTELEAELEAELTKRKQQYEHYRDHLLSFENIADEGGQVEWFALGDIATVTKLAGYEFTKYVTYSNSGNVIALRGLNVKNGQLDLKDVKYIDKSDLSKLNRSKLVIGDMLFTYVGTVGQVALIGENEKYYLAPNVSMIRLNDKNAIMPKYLMYYFQTNTFRSSQIDRLLQASSMQNIPMEKIRKFNIPVPSKKIQERIVYVLDNFDSVCNDLKIGLPAEIEARQKQYEYYRDRLLSFDAVVGGGTERERERSS